MRSTQTIFQDLIQEENKNIERKNDDDHGPIIKNRPTTIHSINNITNCITNNNNTNNSKQIILNETNNYKNSISNATNDTTTTTLSSIPMIEREFPTEIVWRNIIFFIYLHGAAVYGLILLLSGNIMWQTILWGSILTLATGLSITAGCHRLWAHKSYKAKLPLELILITCQTIAFQNSVYEWCRDHRLHHKYSETHADPHNVNRGFFFAHMGWLCCKKHPSVKEKGHGMDMSDLESNSILMFQKKYYIPLMTMFCFIIPTTVPMYFWDETFISSFFFATQLRFCFSLHATWLVNSAAHLWGSKPYNKNINPSENKFVSLFALGEGWHNYHHTFPWDYKTAELGNYEYNWTAGFIDWMSWIGWAYDLKTVDKNAVLKRVERTGDGSHPHHHHHHQNHNHNHTNSNSSSSSSHGGGCNGGGPWGWDDKDISQEDLQITQIINKCF